jgi:predicted nucleotidyltransferase
MKLTEISLTKKDLAWLDNKYAAVLFGSIIEGGSRPKSDIDVAIVSFQFNKNTNIELKKKLLDKFPLKYDIHVFELLPIYIQISAIKNYKVIFGNPLDISEYFYLYRKKWDDCKYRILLNQFSSYQERLSIAKSRV